MLEQVETDAEGRFRLRDVPTGYDWRFTAWRWQPEERWEVESNELRLEAPAEQRIKLVLGGSGNERSLRLAEEP